MAIATEVIKGPQAIFDHVTKHLLEQNKRSTYKECDMCMYRGDEDTACAAGCLIPEEDYDPDMEGSIWTELSFCIDHKYSSEENRLIRTLQCIHDLHPVENWNGCFRLVAIAFGFKFEEVTYE